LSNETALFLLGADFFMNAQNSQSPLTIEVVVGGGAG
jgi:hypothetical protein